MPRGPVRQPTADVDLHGILLQRQELPSVVSSRTLFDDNRPLELEIGTGKGLFLTTAAEANPRRNFVGIEIVPKYARLAAWKLVRQSLGNAKVIAGDAGPILSERVDDATLDAVHVYFPDPWWKKRHRKRRVLNESSLREISRVLRPGGRFHFWTDVLDYFEDTIELAASVAPELGVPLPESASSGSHELDYRTHFERRSRQHNIPVYRVRYEK